MPIANNTSALQSRRPLSKMLTGQFLCLLLLAATSATAWAERNIAVLYPNVSEPYLSVFQTIIEGIESVRDIRATAIAVSDTIDMETLAKKGVPEKYDGMISLGRQGLLAARTFNTQMPVVVGALTFIPDGYSGVSLTPSPELLFDQISELAPTVKQIHVVYDPKDNEWLIRLAEKEAMRKGWQFNALSAHSLREAVHLYRDLLLRIQHKTEAIWLPLDTTTTTDDVVLPLLLEAAWDKDILMFSSKPSHAQRGALFSMVPDQFGLGKQLAQMVLQLSSGEKTPRVQPLSSLKTAVNLRTAAHLGLRFSQKQEAGFNLTFPSQ